jgi:hypothetical protein
MSVRARTHIYIIINEDLDNGARIMPTELILMCSNIRMHMYIYIIILALMFDLLYACNVITGP